MDESSTNRWVEILRYAPVWKMQLHLFFYGNHVLLLIIVQSIPRELLINLNNLHEYGSIESTLKSKFIKV